MVRPTAANLIVPLSRAKDVTPLASVLHVLGTRSRLETLQLLMEGPRLTADVPARADELRMLEDIGVVTSERLGARRVSYRWTLVPGALERVARCLADGEPSGA
ncbi:hypothetical protein [Flexivirga alba]|uniref:Transcriptional regulator n=1 Tax=Flexivirga alba TaxID=702742 RepID=A0ABW2AKR4_9MICO